MKIILSAVIAVALLLNVLRMGFAPRWRGLLSFPFWIYLAWTQWFGGQFHMILALAFLALLAVGRWLNRSGSGADRRNRDGMMINDKENGEDENGDDEEEEDDELTFSLHVDPPDPDWRSRYPDEEAVMRRLERMQQIRYLRILRGDREPWILHSDVDTEPKRDGEVVSALLANIEEYTRGERDLESVTDSLDRLGFSARDKQHEALQRIIESTPDADKEPLMAAIMGGVIWSRHVPPAKPPAELVDWVRGRLSDSEPEERQACAEWLIRHELFDWEEDLGHLEDATLDFLSSQIYWNVPVEHRPAVFRLFRRRYDASAAHPDWKVLRKPLWQVAARLKLTDYKGDPADPFLREASEFLTREMRRLPLESFTDYDIRQNWQAYARGAEGPETEKFLREMTACEIHIQVADEACAALARHEVEGGIEAFLEKFDEGRVPHGADFAMKHEPLRVQIRDHLLDRFAGEETLTGHWEFHQLKFLLWDSDEKILAFCAENAERLRTDLLSNVAWKFFRQDANDVMKTLQDRGLIDPSPFRKLDDPRDLDWLLSSQSTPHTCCLSSDSDEYPPRYDDALREMAAISRGGFPVERARQRILPDPEGKDDFPRISVSWYLGDRKCRFVVEYVGDSMNVRWLLEAANRSLEETGRPDRFFASGDYSYCFHVVFGNPESWIAASREFSVQLHTEPELAAVSEESYREHLLERFRGLAAPPFDRG